MIIKKLEKLQHLKMKDKIMTLHKNFPQNPDKEKTPMKTEYFFVDEAGDSTFFNKHGRNIVGTEGCSKILILGLIRTDNPDELRKSIISLHKEIISDPFYRSVPSVKKTLLSFHAKNDIPEIREKVFRKIKELGFKSEFFVARKNKFDITKISPL